VAECVVHVNIRAWEAEQWHYGMGYGQKEGGVITIITCGPISLTGCCSAQTLYIPFLNYFGWHKILALSMRFSLHLTKPEVLPYMVGTWARGHVGFVHTP